MICFTRSAGLFFSESAKVGFSIVLFGSPSRKPVGVASRRARRERVGCVASLIATGCSVAVEVLTASELATVETGLAFSAGLTSAGAIGFSAEG